ncbi:MAG TPA: LEA type 2 family protein [Stenomitos sp.]
MKRLFPLLFALALPMTVSGCDALGFLAERQAIARAQFDFARAELAGADVPFLTPDSGADLRIVLKVTNPNPLTARLDKLDYDVFLEGTKVGTGTMAQDFAVDANTSKELTLPVHVPYQGLPEAALKAIQARQAALRVAGTSHLSTPLGTLSYPIEVSRTATF